MNLIIKFLLISALLLISSNRSIVTIESKSNRDKKPNIIFILSINFRKLQTIVCAQR